MKRSIFIQRTDDGVRYSVHIDGREVAEGSAPSALAALRLAAFLWGMA